MATISLLSAKGSPGVTTTTLGLTLAWSDVFPDRSALAVDADPIGGDVSAGVLRGAAPVGCGVLSLATSRGVAPDVAVASACVHLRRDGSAAVIPGVPDSSRAAALTLAWDVLSQAEAERDASGADLLIDCGRVDPGTALAPWLAESDLTILVVRPRLTDVTAAHRFMGALAGARPDPHGRLASSAHPLGLVVVEAPSAYRATEVADALGMPLLAALPFEPESARVYSDGSPPGRSFSRSPYTRALHGLASRVGGEVGLRSSEGRPPAPSSRPGRDRWLGVRA